MEFVQELTLDLNANTAYTTIVAKQGDSARWLKVHLTKNNISYDLDPSHSFMFRMRKPDGHGVINPAFIELPQTDEAYIPVTITEDNFNNYVNYYQLQDDEYVKVSTNIFFNKLSNDTPYDPSYYVFDEATGQFVKATAEDSPPYYQFTGASNIYYLQNNINFADATVNIQLTEQILAVSGRGYADIVEYDNADNVLSTVSFILNIMASPDVAGEALSTSEFLQLTEVVADANNIIQSAEAWAQGTKNNANVEVSYAVDSQVREDNFESKKSNLYTYAAPSYVKVDPDASFSSTTSYFALTAGTSNNAKYYAQQAEQAWYNLAYASASATATAASGTQPTATASYNGSASQFEFSFALPAGPTGGRGPNGIYVGSSQPSDSNILVWINPTATIGGYVLDANSVYVATSTEDTNTVNYALWSKQDQINQINANWSTALASVSSAISSANSAAQSASLAADRAEAAYNSLTNVLIIPTMGSSSDWTGILTASGPTVEGIQWSETIPYDLISEKPSINDVELTGNKSFGDLNFPAWSSEHLTLDDINLNGGVPLGKLDESTQIKINKIDNAVMGVSYNASLCPKDEGGVVNLGQILTNRSIINKNYLDNPWFTVNQKGITDYPGYGVNLTGTYICDRWKVIKDQDTNRSVYIVDGAIRITSDSGRTAADNFIFGQIIDDNLWKSLQGQGLRVSVEYYWGNDVNETRHISDWHCVCQPYHEDVDFHYPYKFDERYGWGGDLISDGSQLKFEILWSADYFGDPISDPDIYITRVKLEYGDVTTLDQETPPIYSEELKKCQRYFRRYGGETSANNNPKNTDVILGMGIARSTLILDLMMPGFGDMAGDFTVNMPEGITLMARRGFRAVGTDHQPVEIGVDRLQTYASNPAVTSTTFETDYYYTYDSATSAFVPATTYNSRETYYRQIYKHGLGDTLCATIDRTVASPSFDARCPYYLVLPPTAAPSSGQTEVLSYIEFDAQP